MAATKTALPMLMGKPMPLVGLGTFLSKPGEVEKAVSVAIDVGYRHIDTARGYMNEKEIGNALDESIKAGKVTRDEIFITTKLTGGSAVPHRVRQQTEDSLKCLKTSYIDLLLIHFPVAISDCRLDNNPPEYMPLDTDGAPMCIETDFMDTYKEMEKLVDEGLVKALGISNFNAAQVRRVWDESRIKPCNLGRDADDTPLKDPIVVKIAERLSKTPAQVLLRYLVQRGVIVLPKSVTQSRIESNFQLSDYLELSDSHGQYNMS
ncbi:hypothetical protein EB796_012837 [Bugula neritina]|uniref:NADP-dependent oxidoreductase domain-containing protein n=1 Tax=Bugula neritina TaxID=10212 RepID=A0A7J7JR67_BUGNE|nr:hypothetical protein EB796_012837 [Bugula neritina]